MEEKFINYLFEKGFLNMDEIITKCVDLEIDTTTYKLLKKVVDDYTHSMNK